MKLDRSAELYGRASVIPGRSLTRSKAPGRLFDVGAGPLYAACGEGAILTDVDGRPFIDMICALGAIGLGYSRDVIFGIWPGDVAQCVVRHGWIYSLPHESEVLAAETVLARVAPWATRVRFVKTGSEATHAALLVAQRATGRRAYLRSRASYHGWHTVWQPDATDVRWFDDGQPMGGLADGCCAIFVEPPRWTPCTKEWLQDCQDEAKRAGALLVFDEMIYGGRWALGGATEYFGVTPDLACYGKALGNGAPIAFVVGCDALAEHGELISGTYSGDAAALAALKATIEIYGHQPVIETLWLRGRQLARGLREGLALHSQLGAVLGGQPVHQRLRFPDPATGRRFAALMTQRGVLVHPDVMNVMYAHTEALIERVVEAAQASLADLRKEIA